MSRSPARRLTAALALAGALFTAVLWTVLSSASAAPSSGTTIVTTIFNTTGGEQTFAVPDGVTSLDVVAVGGRGGNGQGVGGFGAVATAGLAVTPGQIIFIEVGGNGALGGSGGETGGLGGFNGGGDGQNTNGNGGAGGGGASDIRTISRADGNVQSSLNSRLLIAGGGAGGGGADTTFYSPPASEGGAAGDPSLGGNGSDGRNGVGGGTLGAGATLTAGGGSIFEAGSLGQGGDGGGGSNLGGGAGGGGGKYGGGGGKGNNDAGGGGGGGGGGSTGFAPTATGTSFQTDTTGIPRVVINYTAGGGSGLKFGKVKRNKRKGTAILPVTVPGSGTLSIGGKGVVKKRPGLDRVGRHLARQVPQAGTYKLKVKAKGAKKQQLFDTGKVKVKAVVTFKPSSGDAVHDTKKIKLKKN
jgi:hypothetical protein